MKINNEKIVKRGFAKFGTLLWGDCQKKLTGISSVFKF